MQYSTVFFDLDDTLWDTFANSRESLEELYHKYEFDKYYETFADFHDIYYPNNISLWHAYEQNSISKQELMETRFYSPFRHIEGMTKQKAMEINNEFMDSTASKSGIIEGTRELLDALKPHYKLCVLSNGFIEVQGRKIESAGLTNYFDKVILSDHIGINKPDAELFDHALREMNTTADKVIMIGDSWNSDIVGAKNSNIDQIWYNPDGISAKDFVPTYTIKKLSEINDILLINQI